MIRHHPPFPTGGSPGSIASAPDRGPPPNEPRWANNKDLEGPGGGGPLGSQGAAVLCLGPSTFLCPPPALILFAATLDSPGLEGVPASPLLVGVVTCRVPAVAGRLALGPQILRVAAMSDLPRWQQAFVISK